jgi:hypothetical protein
MGKGLSAAAVVMGTGLVCWALVADLGAGQTGGYAFGWEQKLGVVVGTTVAWFATLRLAEWSPRSRRGRDTASDPKTAGPAASASA